MSTLKKKQFKLYEKLYEHQKPAADFVMSRDSAALFLEQRVGKTYITGAVIEAENEPGYYALIVVPLTNKVSTWAKLFAEYLPHIDIKYDLTKPDKNKPTVVLMHYEQALRIYKKLGKRKWSRVVIDESQRLKDRGSKQSRMGRALRHALKKLILSGTPIEEAPQDLWPQFRFLAPEVFGENWKDFDEEYLTPTGYMGYKRKFRELKRDKFMSKIKPYSMRITKDVVGIKQAKIIRHPVRLRGEQRELYDAINRNMVAQWQGHDVASGMTITQNILLQQIAGGFVRDDEDTIHWVGDAKLRKLKVVLQTRIEGPAIIFCKFKAEMAACRRVCKELGLSVAVISSKRKAKKNRPQLLAKFQAGKIDVIISHVRTGGVGIDLWAANDAIFYSLSYSYIDYEQAKARLDCIGKKSSVRVHLIYAEKTIDEPIYETILSKRSVSDKLLNRLRRKDYGRSSKESESKDPQSRKNGYTREGSHLRCGRTGKTHGSARSIRPRKAA